MTPDERNLLLQSGIAIEAMLKVSQFAMAPWAQSHSNALDRLLRTTNGEPTTESTTTPTCENGEQTARPSVPRAIQPERVTQDGLNPLGRPYVLFVDASGKEFRVYDRVMAVIGDVMADR